MDIRKRRRFGCRFSAQTVKKRARKAVSCLGKKLARQDMFLSENPDSRATDALLSRNFRSGAMIAGKVHQRSIHGAGLRKTAERNALLRSKTGITSLVLRAGSRDRWEKEVLIDR